MIETLTTVALSVTVGVCLSLVTYIGKSQKGEPFAFGKLLRTLLVGLVLGGFASWQGFTLTADNFDAYLAANTGAVAIADQLFKILLRLAGDSEPGRIGPDGWVG